MATHQQQEGLPQPDQQSGQVRDLGDDNRSTRVLGGRVIEAAASVVGNLEAVQSPELSRTETTPLVAFMRKLLDEFEEDDGDYSSAASAPYFRLDDDKQRPSMFRTFPVFRTQLEWVALDEEDQTSLERVQIQRPEDAKTVADDWYDGKYTPQNVLTAFLNKAVDADEVRLIVDEVLCRSKKEGKKLSFANCLGRSVNSIAPEAGAHMFERLEEVLEDQPDHPLALEAYEVLNITLRNKLRSISQGAESSSEEQADIAQIWKSADEHNLIDTDGQLFASSVLLTYPFVALTMASKTAEKDFFADIPLARWNIGLDYLHRVLAYVGEQEGRSSNNAKKIKRVLFGEGARAKKVPPLHDLIRNANLITDQMNKHIPEEVRWTRLDEKAGASGFAQCGEAVFRILNATGHSQEAVEQNRAYAEIFDAIMRPEYERYSQPYAPTVADICARYPDAEEDIVLELREVAGGSGYVAATAHYNAVKGALTTRGRKRLNWGRNKSGYGVIS